MPRRMPATLRRCCGEFRWRLRAAEPPPDRVPARAGASRMPATLRWVPPRMPATLRAVFANASNPAGGAAANAGNPAGGSGSGAAANRQAGVTPATTFNPGTAHGFNPNAASSGRPAVTYGAAFNPSAASNGQVVRRRRSRRWRYSYGPRRPNRRSLAARHRDDQPCLCKQPGASKCPGAGLRMRSDSGRWVVLDTAKHLDVLQQWQLGQLQGWCLQCPVDMAR